MAHRRRADACIPGGLSENGSAKLKPAARRILIFLSRLMLRRKGVSF
jgi:hypothetical protein